MSTTVCASNYEYQGQVYSPAFSEPSSPMSSSSTTSSEPPSPKPSNHDYHDYFEEEEVFVSKRPKFANKYEEMLQPLDPVRILPSHQIVKHNNRYVFLKEISDMGCIPEIFLVDSTTKNNHFAFFF